MENNISASNPDSEEDRCASEPETESSLQYTQKPINVNSKLNYYIIFT